MEQFPQHPGRLTEFQLEERIRDLLELRTRFAGRDADIYKQHIACVKDFVHGRGDERFMATYYPGWTVPDLQDLLIRLGEVD